MGNGNNSLKAVILSVLMVLSIVAMGSASGMAASDGPTVESDSADESAADKQTASEDSSTDDGSPETVSVSDELESADGQQELLIVLEDDLSVGQVASPSEAATSLKKQATDAQEPVVEDLEQLDHVQVTKQFWIGNVVAASIDLNKGDLKSLTKVDGVAAVQKNYDLTKPEPVEVGSESGVSSEDHGDYTYGLEQINVPEFWDEYGQGDGSTIAIMDGGVAVDHPDIDATEAVAIDNNGNVLPDAVQPDYHGTHVASTATGGNASGTHIGVAPNADLYAADVFAEGGQVSSLVGAIQWAVENDADVVSGSLGFGGQGDPPLHQQALIDPVQNANDAGTAVVSSSSNAGDGLVGGYGANFDTFSVGASNDAGGIASFSSGSLIDKDKGQPDWPPSAYSDDLLPAQSYENPPADWPQQWVKPDISAPGASVYGADLPGSAGNGAGDYTTISGTSMAAPHVAGAIGLLQSATDDHLTDKEIEAALAETAEKPDSEVVDSARWDIANKDSRYGIGIIDVKAAADLLTSDGTATIEGTVTDDDGAAVSGAQVTTEDGLVAGTDENGSYSLEVAANQTLELTADGFGFESTTQTVDLTDVSASEEAVTASFGAETSSGSSQAALENPLGDVDEDGEVTIDDAVAIQRHSLGLDTDINENLADVDRDGEVTIDDAVLAQEISLGIAEEASLDVTNLEAPSSVPMGETIEVTATIENSGDVGAVTDIEYSVANSDVSQTAEVDIGAADTSESTQEVTFDVTADWGPGEYEHGVTAGDATSMAPITVEDGDAPGEIETPNVTQDFTLSPTTEIDTEYGTEQPVYAEIGSTFQVSYDVANLEQYTASLTSDSNVSADDVTLTLNGDEISLDEEVTFNESLTGAFDLNVSVADAATEDEVLNLEHSFSGSGDTVTKESGPSTLTTDLEPGYFELSNFESNSSFLVEEGNPVNVAVDVTNTGQETVTRDIDYIMDGSTGIPQLETLTLEPGETQRIEASITGLAGVMDGGQVVEHGFVTEVTQRGIFSPFPQEWDEELFEEVKLLEPGTGLMNIQNAGMVETEPGTTATVSVDLVNLGGEETTKSVEFEFAGETKSQEVTLSSGEERTVEFDVTPTEQGEHSYTVSTPDDSASGYVLAGVEANQFDVTVVQQGDDYGEATASMMDSQISPVFDVSTVDSAEAMDVADETDVFVFHDLPESDADANELISTVEDDPTTGAIYLDQWGGNSNAIPIRSDAIGDPTTTDEGDSFGSASAPVSMNIQADHPIFDGVGESGDSVVLHEVSSADMTWFEGASGDTLAESSDSSGSVGGPAVSVDPDSNAVLVSSIAPGEYVGSADYTDDAASILTNAVKFAEEQRTFTGSITGNVTDADTGDGVENVTVTAEDQNGNTYTVSTDADGSYEINEVNPGHYVVNTNNAPAGYETEAIVTVDVGETSTANFEVVPQKSTITGTVVDAETGDPIEDAEIVDADAGAFDTTTDADGEFSLDSDSFERGDTVALRSTATDYNQSNLEFVEIEPGENEVTFELEADNGGNGEFDVAQYDANDDGIISLSEATTAVVDYNANGELSLSEVSQVVAAYNTEATV